MYKRFTLVLCIVFVLIVPVGAFAQSQDRIQVLQQKLEVLSTDLPGLEQKVDMSVTGITLQQYLLGLSKSANISISVDPQLNFTVFDSLNGVTVANILLFLAKKYNLDVNITGSILSVTPYIDPNRFAKPPEKELKIKYENLSNTLSVDLNNDSLTAVARKITQLSGKNVIVPNTLQTKTITAFLQEAPFDAGIEKVAFTNQLKMVKTSDNFYLFQPLEENEETYVNSDRNTGVRKTFHSAPSGQHGSAGLFIRTVNGQKLISADATGTPIADLIRQASEQIGINYSIYSEIKGAITVHVNDISYEDFLNILFNGSEYTFHKQGSVYLIGDSRLEGLRAFKVIQLQNRSIDTVVTMIPTDWKRDIEIKEFREQNTLLISGSNSRISEVEAFIKQLDVLVPVVLIEVTMIDINKTRNVATGIALGVSDSVKTGGTILPGVNFTFSATSINNFLSSISKFTSIDLGHVVPNFYASLNALETNNNVNIRSMPKLAALNGHTATLSIGNSVYYKNTTQVVLPSAATTSNTLTNTYIESDANMTIGVKPLISGDDQITLGIKIDISDFTSIPTDGSPPPKSTSKYETSLRVNNEDMILLGGIERNEITDNVSGTPVLSRIPILKYFFSNKSKTTTKVVSVIFIKPTIMR
jgi:type IV pilus assembly protein PilQ